MKYPYVIALAAILAGVGSLAFIGFSEDSAYFVDVAEAQRLDINKLHGARLFGTVSGSDLHKSADGKFCAFRLQDRLNPANTLAVRYHGVLPDTFKVGAEVIVEGDMTAEGFAARTIMTKCPSKYQKENRRS